MFEPPIPDVSYLECPRCGARYLERDQRGVLPADGGQRWFSCHRCKKRVRSAAPARAQGELSLSETTAAAA